MISFPPCKINLGLRVLRKRTDGYHDLDTSFYPVPFTDVLEVIPAAEFAFSFSGIVISGNAADNLCVKAYNLLRNRFDLGPVSIHLHKIIPSGAGLGGGSSDAAHTLRLLNEVFSLSLSRAQLIEYAAQLGSDCAFFIFDEPMTGKGRGEVLEPAAVLLRGFYLVLINPGIHVSTADAFRGVSPEVPAQSVEDVLKLPVTEWRSHLLNDFEKSVFDKYPAIAQIKNSLYRSGAIYSSMSGSGSTVFGIFNEQPVLSGQLTSMMIWKGLIT